MVHWVTQAHITQGWQTLSSKLPCTTPCHAQARARGANIYISAQCVTQLYIWSALRLPGLAMLQGQCTLHGHRALPIWCHKPSELHFVLKQIHKMVDCVLQAKHGGLTTVLMHLYCPIIQTSARKSHTTLNTVTRPSCQESPKPNN